MSAPDSLLISSCRVGADTVMVARKASSAILETLVLTITFLTAPTVSSGVGVFISVPSVNLQKTENSAAFETDSRHP